jgi:hypothetical protein
MTASAEIRRRLGHPVIDTDGHFTELAPVFEEYVAEYGGPSLVDAMRRISRDISSYFEDNSDQAGRRDRGDRGLPIYWTVPAANTLDRATSALPRLLYERLPEFGLDFSILFPTRSLFYPHIVEADVRLPMCRAFNHYVADMFGPYSDRLTPGAMIPLHTPDEGIAELEYAVTAFGLKAAMIPTYVRRPARGLPAEYFDIAYQAGTLDFYGLDSDFDYDPFWAKAIELKVMPATHSTGMGWGSRRSYTNFMYNHMGHFAAASDGLAKALVLGGVTSRFPDLRVAFLECGAAWATNLYSDMIAHWVKRNPTALKRDLDPETLDVEMFVRLAESYGDERVKARVDDIRPQLGRPQARPATDDWAALAIERPEQFRDLFEPHFYYGCEADDPTNAIAFKSQLHPYGAQFRAMLSSDISHWDVSDMTEVLEEAFELVEHGLIDEDQFRQFTFGHAVSGFSGANPEFFAGTAIESAVRTELHRT